MLYVCFVPHCGSNEQDRAEYELSKIQSSRTKSGGISNAFLMFPSTERLSVFDDYGEVFLFIFFREVYYPASSS